MTVTRKMLGAAHDVLLKHGLMLSGVMLEEIYGAMEFECQKDGYSDGDTQDVLLAKIAKLQATLRQAREALGAIPYDLEDGMFSRAEKRINAALAAINAALGE